MATVRGTRILLGQELEAISRVSSAFRSIGQKYGFEDIEMPVLERSDLFEREEEFSKAIYSFNDKSQRKLALRPEFTAQIAKFYIDNQFKYHTGVKWMTQGPLYRYDRPQKGRYREFRQFNMEVLNRSSYFYEAEMIYLITDVFEEISVADQVSLKVNTLGSFQDRVNYAEALKRYFQSRQTELSITSRNRIDINPIRILDSKNENDVECSKKAPSALDFMSKESIDRFESFKKLLKTRNIDFKVDHNLVRGLDYYCHTIFEYVDVANKYSVLGGGRYDGLSLQLGCKQLIPSVGFAAGLDRLANLISYSPPVTPKVVVLPISGSIELLSYSASVLSTLRDGGLRCDVSIHPNKLSTRLSQCGDKDFAVIVGDKEMGNGTVVLKNLLTKEEFSITASGCIPVIKNEESVLSI